MALIGRENEISILRDLRDSDKSEFAAIYGRRRVGKTFLVKELFGDEFTFYSTGVLDGAREVQLKAFNKEISRFGGEGLAAADNWMGAFENLNLLIERSPKERKIVFLDEIPWMATTNSDFLPGLDYFWNRWASSRKDVFLIVCGSAASWMADNIIDNKRGLHNRLTRQICLEAFTLNECERFFKSRRIPITRYQMAEAYMIFGGIPYYLSLMNPKYSLYQNVDAMYFAQNAELRDEFDNLYRSLYRNAENYIRVVEALGKKGIGLTRAEVSTGSKIADGGSLTKILRDLSLSGIIREYKAFGRKKRESIYQLIDPFSLFDLRFRSIRELYSKDYWIKSSASPAHSAWSGYAYEKLCLLHLDQILKKLGISGVLTSVFSWRGESGGTGAQIDMIIDRNDSVINLCEIKYSSGEYSISKSYNKELRNKSCAFVEATRTRKAVQTTMITTFGLKRNAYSEEITSQVTLDDLFS
ncbi:MAG: AAA family ATPase [Clostridiales bacterium]|nr:AAA family ATPase [Clostridiales bacterium]